MVVTIPHSKDEDLKNDNPTYANLDSLEESRHTHIQEAEGSDNKCYSDLSLQYQVPINIYGSFW